MEKPEAKWGATGGNALHMRGIRTLLAVAALLLVAPACSTVKYTYLKSGYKKNERQWLKRVALVVDTAPAPGGEEGGGERTSPAPVPDLTLRRLFLAMESDYLSHHRQYIILRTAPGGQLADLKRYCSSDPTLDGVIFSRFLRLEREQKEAEVELTVRSSLYDCRFGEKIWESLGENSYPERRKGTADLVDSYVGRWGEESRPYVVPYYMLVRSLFASLPDPHLSESDLEAKIDADATGPVEGLR